MSQNNRAGCKQKQRRTASVCQRNGGKSSAKTSQQSGRLRVKLVSAADGWASRPSKKPNSLSVQAVTIFKLHFGKSITREQCLTPHCVAASSASGESQPSICQRAVCGEYDVPKIGNTGARLCGGCHIDRSEWGTVSGLGNRGTLPGSMDGLKKRFSVNILARWDAYQRRCQPHYCLNTILGQHRPGVQRLYYDDYDDADQ